MSGRSKTRDIPDNADHAWHVYHIYIHSDHRHVIPRVHSYQTALLCGGCGVSTRYLAWDGLTVSMASSKKRQTSDRMAALVVKINFVDYRIHIDILGPGWQ